LKCQTPHIRAVSCDIKKDEQMTFADQYIQTLQRVYDLTKNGQTETIKTDFSITKMFGAWSSIFWALTHFDKFNDFSIEQLKDLVKALITGHINYGKTTNQFLRTETIDWISSSLKIKVSVSSTDKNEVFYVQQWIENLYTNPDTEYLFSFELGLRLEQEQNESELVKQQSESDKAKRLELEEIEREKRQAEKQKHFFEHLERNLNQKNKRDNFLKEFGKQTILKKLKTIVSDNKPLHYYPTDISNVQEKTLRELSWNDRDTFYKMIKKYRIKEWYETRDKIQMIDNKYHS